MGKKSTLYFTFLLIDDLDFKFISLKLNKKFYLWEFDIIA